MSTFASQHQHHAKAPEELGTPFRVQSREADAAALDAKHQQAMERAQRQLEETRAKAHAHNELVAERLQAKGDLVAVDDEEGGEIIPEGIRLSHKLHQEYDALPPMPAGAAMDAEAGGIGGGSAEAE